MTSPIASKTVPLDELELPYLDIRDERFLTDHVAVLRGLRAKSELARSERGVEVLSYELIASLLTDKRLETPGGDHFAAKGAPEIVVEFIDEGLLLNFSPERHLRVRRVMAAAFRANKIEEQRADMEGIANRLVDGFADAGRCDLTQEFSHHYSIEVLCRLIGVPAEHIPQFSEATLQLVLLLAVPFEPGRERLATALKELWDYSAELLDLRRADPGDDFISALIEAQRTEGKLTETELIWGVANLLFAGHDTTRYQLGSCVRALIETDQWQVLTDEPGLIPQVVEEGMRFYPVSSFLTREVREPVELGGASLPVGSKVILNMLAATRDPESFPDPDRFDIRRSDVRRVPFGHGLHKCLGHALARLEMEVALEVLGRRLLSPRFDGPVVEMPANGGMTGAKSLPLAFEQRR